MTASEPPAEQQADEQRLDALLSGQIDYYRAIAPRYEENALSEWSGTALEQALDSFAPRGRVLELACGTGPWTQLLAPRVESLTALDASPEMLEIARTRVPGETVRFVQADVFEWQPQERYDTVVFAFWLSHVPLQRFESFWALVDRALKPGGRVFFVDDAHRTPEELIHGSSSEIVERKLGEAGTRRIVKVAHTPVDLQARLHQLGWRIAVRSVEGPFYCGEGTRA